MLSALTVYISKMILHLLTLIKLEGVNPWGGFSSKNMVCEEEMHILLAS